MDFTAHYGRACELADLADETYRLSLLATTDEDRLWYLRRAEAVGQMATARAQLAWVAYMGADTDAAARLAEDAKHAPVVQLLTRPAPGDPA